MPRTKRLTLETVDFEDPRKVDEFLRQVITAGMKRVRAETAELRARGFIDQDGNLGPVPTVQSSGRNAS
jgi:hypothetical protein